MSEDFIEDILADTTLPTNPITDDTILIPTDSSNNEQKTQALAPDKATITTPRIPVSAPTNKTSTKPSDVDITKDAAITNSELSKNDDVPHNQVTIESLAKQLGWSPEHKGDTYVDAATYILRSKDIQESMKTHNRELKGQLSDLKSSVDALQQHNEQVYQAEVKKLTTELKTLKAERDNAIELGDVNKVNDLDEKIDTVKESLSQPIPKPTRSSNPAYDDWLVDNQWYVTDPEMASYADQIAQQYVGAPADRIYKAVRGRVEELWPEKFTKQPNQTQTTNLHQITTDVQAMNKQQQEAPAKPVGPSSPVESGHQNAAPQTITKADLTDSQRAIMRQFSQLGIMTEDQYISDIAKLQGE